MPSLQLRPVIELAPTDYASLDPNRAPLADDAAVAAQWTAAMQHAGIHIPAARPDQWYVYTDDLVDPSPLDTVLRVALRAAHTTADIDRIPAFSGGFALVEDGVPRILPRCCGTLADLFAWELAAAYRETAPRELWIGHPPLLASYDDPWMIIEEAQEGGWPEQPQRLMIAPTTIVSMVADAWTPLNAFRDRLVTRLRQGAIPGREPAAVEIVNRLIGMSAVAPSESPAQ